MSAHPGPSVTSQPSSQDVPGHHEVKQGPLQRCAIKILAIPGFESGMSCIIMINMFVMIVETDLQANEASDKDGIHWTEVFSWFALSVFVFELVVRLLAKGCTFWHDPWDVADFCIVSADFLMSIMGLIAGSLFPVSVLRIFRLAKLARVTQMMRVLPELRMLMKGLLGSLRAIFWGALMLLLFLLLWSMVAVQVIHPLNKNVDYGDCERCNRAYGSVASAALTIFQQVVAGDSWGQLTIPVIEEHPMSAAFFIPVFVSLGMAVMNLILGVVVSLAQTVYDQEEKRQEAEKQLLKLEKQSNIMDLCKQMDEDESGELSRDEVYNGFLQEGEFRDCVLALGITDEDFDIAWASIDTERTGSVSYKDLIFCLTTMKTSDTSFLLTYVKYYITWMKSALVEHMDRDKQEAQKIELQLQDTIHIVENQEQTLRQSVVMESSIPSDGQHISTNGLDAPAEPKTRQENTLHCEGSVLTVADNAIEVRGQCSGRAEWNKSSTVADSMQELLKQIDNDIAKLRIDLRERLMDIICESSRRALVASGHSQKRLESLDRPSMQFANSQRTHQDMLTSKGPDSAKGTSSHCLSSASPTLPKVAKEKIISEL